MTKSIEAGLQDIRERLSAFIQEGDSIKMLFPRIGAKLIGSMVIRFNKIKQRIEEGTSSLGDLLDILRALETLRRAVDETRDMMTFVPGNHGGKPHAQLLNETRQLYAITQQVIRELCEKWE